MSLRYPPFDYADVKGEIKQRRSFSLFDQLLVAIRKVKNVLTWAVTEALWTVKAVRAMRAMRVKTLQTLPSRLYFGGGTTVPRHRKITSAVLKGRNVTKFQHQYWL